jgi:diguanylate cyclase (GGDEF)-like protein
MPQATHAVSAPQRILVIGAGRGGTALMDLFQGDPMIEIVGVMDLDPEAPAMRLAAQQGIARFTNLEQALASCQPCLAFNLTGDPTVSAVAQTHLGDSNVIGGFAAHFLWTLLTRLKQTQDQIAHLAYHDALTGLPNRILFYDRLGQAIARARRAQDAFAALYLDLDGFKAVNDAYGHDVGDALLREAAQRIKACVRESDTVARMGGDEFTVILNDIKAPHNVQRVSDCLLRTLSSPFTLNTRCCQVGVSIGIALYPNHAATAEQLVRSADAAMYWAKQGGKNRYRFFGEGA